MKQWKVHLNLADLSKQKLAKHDSGTKIYLTISRADVTADSLTNEPSEKEDNQSLTQVHELSDSFYVSYP